MKTTKTFDALINAIKSRKLESNNQLTNMMFILNNCPEEKKQAIKDANPDYESIELCEDQVKKGFDWLKNLWVTPTGKERKNNPFGYREQDILKNFDTITLNGWYDAGNAWHSFNVPLYLVHGSNNTFEYYVSGGEIHIIG